MQSAANKLKQQLSLSSAKTGSAFDCQEAQTHILSTAMSIAGLCVLICSKSTARDSAHPQHL